MKDNSNKRGNIPTQNLLVAEVRVAAAACPVPQACSIEIMTHSENSW